MKLDSPGRRAFAFALYCAAVTWLLVVTLYVSGIFASGFGAALTGHPLAFLAGAVAILHLPAFIVAATEIALLAGLVGFTLRRSLSERLPMPLIGAAVGWLIPALAGMVTLLQLTQSPGLLMLGWIALVLLSLTPIGSPLTLPGLVLGAIFGRLYLPLLRRLGLAEYQAPR
jgi:hypothetical protein